MAGVLPPVERRGGVLLLVFATLSLVLLVVGDRLPTASLRAIGAFLFGPFDRVVLVVDRVAAAWRENESLHQRVTQLELENARLREAGVENATLRRQLGLPPSFGLPLQPVEVLALSGDPYPTAATLSAGMRQHVHVGDAVVTREGLLGRVSETYLNESRAVLLTDPSSAVACAVESTGVLGVLRFTTVPRPRLLLTGVGLGDTVRVGERVVTSGLSRRYPRAIPVGTIVKLGRDASALTQELEVEPAVRPSRLRHAFVAPHPAALEGTPP
jgi:rod shape-determining protein MreC